MNVPSVGNPLLHAATLAAQKHAQAHPPAPPAAETPPPRPGSGQAPRPASGQAPAGPAPDPVAIESPQPRAASGEPPQAVSGQPRSREELDQLAADVLAIFDDSPDRLGHLVATLKRLEGRAS